MQTILLKIDCARWPLTCDIHSSLNLGNLWDYGAICIFPLELVMFKGKFFFKFPFAHFRFTPSSRAICFVFPIVWILSGFLQLQETIYPCLNWHVILVHTRSSSASAMVVKFNRFLVDPKSFSRFHNFHSIPDPKKSAWIIEFMQIRKSANNMAFSDGDADADRVRTGLYLQIFEDHLSVEVLLRKMNLFSQCETWFTINYLTYQRNF